MSRDPVKVLNGTMNTPNKKVGSIFDSSCEVKTVTVNCVGVMGAGVALECKIRFPCVFEQYSRDCSNGCIQPGTLHLYTTSTDEKILCFPTKKHWKDPSELSYISNGLESLGRSITEWGVKSIALPRLGCSHGGLSWDDVEPLMTQAANESDGVHFEFWTFDPHIKDDYCTQLKERLIQHDGAGIQKSTGLSAKQSEILFDTIRDPSVVSMHAIQKTRGLGKVAFQKIYRFIQKENSIQQKNLWD